ncbi:Uncharacterized protein Rs2_15464 [Raphanus sativus]|nr:Uncharacterized protein Rs2_15464 [Raphanus sativus]
MAPPSPLAVPPMFDDLEGVFCNKEVLVRLIHCCKSRNFTKANMFMGVELLLIDSKKFPSRSSNVGGTASVDGGAIVFYLLEFFGVFLMGVRLMLVRSWVLWQRV